MMMMTALAQRIKETPMAPYMGVMQSLSRKDIDIVVTFLNEVKASVPARAGWAAAAKQAHADGEDKLIAADVFEDETMEDWECCTARRVPPDVL